MGISRDSRHKKRMTGGRMPIHQKKRKFEMGRQPALTKIGEKSYIYVRGRGGNYKMRALKLDHGNFSWQTESMTRKTRIIDTTYNASNNEYTRTKTLVKNTIIQIDAAPFVKWYKQHYGIELSKKGGDEETKVSKSVQNKQKFRCKDRKIDENVVAQMNTGRVYACISSRPGQSGRADGYILEGKELDFYLKKMQKKGKKGKKGQQE